VAMTATTITTAAMIKAPCVVLNRMSIVAACWPASSLLETQIQGGRSR
jgi:hypothetical protein